MEKNASKIQSAWKMYGKKNLNEGQLMQGFLKGCRNIGLTPEGVFRAADKRQKKILHVDELKSFLRNMKIGLT